MARLSLALFPHKGIRNIFSKLLVQAGSTDYTNKNKVFELYDFGKYFFEMLSIHADDENSIVLSELEKKVPGSSSHDMAEHEKIETEQANLENLLTDIYNLSQKGEDVSSKGFEFYLALSKFQSLYNLHMFGE